ncbi:MAG: hypothetical protein NTZ94_17560 [Verrucomicrobia bacterium]|nr:hypothetical protein [Verrucomicrobiota bacterium]
MKIKKNRNALSAPTKKIRKGVQIYKVHSSPYWKARVWVPSQGKYIVRSTKESSKIEASHAAEEFASSLFSRGALAAVPKSRTFETYADRLIYVQQERQKLGQIHRGTAQGDEYTIRNKTWGLVAYFGRRDISTIKPKDVSAYVVWMQKERTEPLAPSTINRRVACLRKILGLARHDDLIAEIPSTPRTPRKDSPRPFFRFAPLVDPSQDNLDKLLKSADALAEIGDVVRGVKITYELKDLMRFLLSTFMRPTLSEVFGVKHAHVNVATNPDRLMVTIPKGKTGHRVVSSLPYAIFIYRRIQLRTPDAKPDDFIFLPAYRNRATAMRIMQRQFKRALEFRELEFDPVTGDPHSLYSLRHTAICERLVTSDGQVNIWTLARNAGTSPEQIDRFYAKHLPIGPELAKNLHIKGEWQIEAEKETAQATAKNATQLKKLGLKPLKIGYGPL